ncbi:ferredoxin--NADP reductase, embryo isozyme, chloroplastic-like [Dioscorea cayenensis subsp. rotundata]|uniref:ferredoxin--NADP(+) reductase n=1 Tax=Dioscorea cayennensis subsp. rotundata TaxID=55577 RepID=A0AB40C3J0_DIOCR|nr:ferredoxin--NADP reductase, embryo isozyme, chloroplastic-like [Dioscorea cayenensis subsp. rotundata]
MALKAEIKSLKNEVAKEAPSIIHKAGKPYTTKVVSVDTLVGPKGGLGEICHIILDHGGQFHFVEGQYLGVILHPDDDDDSLHTPFRVIIHAFSIASCRDGDSFDGKKLSLCVRRAELSPHDASNFLCNRKEGDEVDIIVPGYTWWLDSAARTHINVSMQGCLNCRTPSDGERYIYMGT